MKTRLVNITSGNDVCPSYVRPCDLPVVDAIGTASGYVPVLWCDAEDIDDRESGSFYRYVVTGLEHQTIIETDNYHEAVAALYAQPIVSLANGGAA